MCWLTIGCTRRSSGAIVQLRGGVPVAIVLVDHDEFRNVPLGERRHLSVPDTRGIWRLKYCRGAVDGELIVIKVGVQPEPPRIVTFTPYV
jgi:hypothetical protein